MFSKNTVIAFCLILSSLVIGMVSSWTSIQAFKGISFFLYSFSLSQGAILPVIILMIVALPFSNAYLQDKENNMIYGMLTRTTLKRYYLTKFLVNSLVSTLVGILPLALFFNC